MSKKAFTLIELLIVVLIIGILSAIAIPMYQGAVDKSHWSTMLPGAKAIKDAEEAFKMSNDGYTDTMGNLDVTMENSDLTFNLITPNNTSDPNVIRVTNSKLANVRLASYLDDNPKFAGQLHCEAATGDERANRLCGKLLMGQELTSADGYTGYLLDQEIDKATCDNASRSWSTSKTKCYKDDQTRCDALNMNYLGDGQCGFDDEAGRGQVIGAEGVCYGHTRDRGCAYAQIKEGGACIVTDDRGSCASISVTGGTAICVKGSGCSYSTFDNGICVAANHMSCQRNKFINGSICYAPNGGWAACGGTANYDSATAAATFYDDTSCCCGAGCGTAPKCADRGIACDPYYMDLSNFMN
ncbi:MAG: pilin [Elusimicrobiaceae bacterium]|nr:pilin [Elusimicrobiaceae bacterium]